MTIRLSLRAVAFVVYTLALLGAAFGISYAVFEWRHDDGGAGDTSAIEQRIDELERASQAGPTQAELDVRRCEAALAAAGNSTIVSKVLRDQIDRYCK